MGEFVNSTQMQFTKSDVSCGILECHHLPDHSASKLCFSIATALYHKANPRPSAFVLFSDVVDTDNSRGKRLADFILDNPAQVGGYLYATERVVNPKSGNIIQVWLWTLDHDTLKAFYTDELANRIDV